MPKKQKAFIYAVNAGLNPRNGMENVPAVGNGIL